MIYKAITFLSYLKNGKTKYRLHSPFVFNFLTNTMADKRKYYAFEEINAIKKYNRQQDKEIAITDFGAGSDGKVQKTRAIKSVARQSAIPKKYGELLFKIVEYYQPANILELGTCIGIGTLYMATANTAIPVITIEGDANLAEIAASNFKRYPKELQNISQVIGNFDDVLPSVIYNLPKIGLAFIDGNHRKAPTLNYFNQIIDKCTASSILIFDDIYWSKEMIEAWEEIKSHKKVKLTIDLYRMGLVFFVEEKKEVEHFKLYF